MDKPPPTLTMWVVLPLLAVTSTACGSDSDQTSTTGDNYCSTLENAGSGVLTHDPGAMNDVAEFAALRTNISTLDRLAPVEVKTAWGVLRDDFDGYTGAMDKAGISAEELLYMDDNGKLPGSVDPKQFAQFVRGLEALDRSKTDQATNTIVAHAKTECGINVDPDPD